MIDDSIQRILELQSHYAISRTPEMVERGNLVSEGIAKRVAWNFPNIDPLGLIPDLSCEGQDQMGNKSRVPYVRIFSKILSPRAPIGWYLVFLFGEAGRSAYLTIGHGSTDPDSRRVRSDEEMAQLVQWGLSKLPSTNSIDERLVHEIDLDSGKGRLGRAYEKTTLFGFEYIKGDIPSETQLISDITKLIPLLAILYQAELNDPTLPGSQIPESLDAHIAIEEAAGRRSYARRRGGARLTVAEKKVIEMEAVRQAILYFKAQGWESVEDVGDTKSFDLACKSGEEFLYVEVKGTTSHGEAIVLTRNEVELHKNEYPKNALFVLHDIVLTKGDDPAANGGVQKVFQPWEIMDEKLRAIGYDYSL
jgi:hypothetical protein